MKYGYMGRRREAAPVDQATVLSYPGTSAIKAIRLDRSTKFVPRLLARHHYDVLQLQAANSPLAFCA